MASNLKYHLNHSEGISKGYSNKSSVYRIHNLFEVDVQAEKEKKIGGIQIQHVEDKTRRDVEREKGEQET